MIDAKRYLFKSTASKDGSINPKKKTESPVRDNLREAMIDAHGLAPKNKVVTILRAETSGVNEGTFFLHLILK